MYDTQRRTQDTKAILFLSYCGGAAVGDGWLQQELEEDAVEELGFLLRRQVPWVWDHLHRGLLPELPASVHSIQLILNKFIYFISLTQSTVKSLKSLNKEQTLKMEH